MNHEPIKLFDDFTLDLTRGCLMHRGSPVHLRPQSYEVLKYLVENQGRLISKDQVIKEVWQGRAVTDGALGKCIEEVREALGEGSRRYVRNVRGRGYIFDPGTDERGQSGSQLTWSEEVDVVRVTVEGEEQGKRVSVSSRALEVPHSQRALLDSRRRTGRKTLVMFALCALGIALIAAAAYYLSSGDATKPRSINVKSLAVLPFKLLGDEKGNEFLGIGIADTLITRLSNVKEISVRPTSAVLKYGDGGQRILDIGRQLGVESILEGSIHTSGDRMRVTVQLVRVDDQTPIWAEKFDEQFTDIFKLEDSISQQVAERLTLSLSNEERRALARHHTESAEAHLLNLRGRYRLEKRTREGMLKAVEFFEKAIDTDANYARAYSSLAEAYFSLSITGTLPPREAFPKVREAATKSLQIDPHLAEAQLSLGLTSFFHDWDWAAADREFNRAIEINPNYAAARVMYAHLLSNLGRHPEALAQSSQALELDHLSLIITAIRGQVLFFAGQYDNAIVHLKNAVDVEPNFWIFHLLLGKIYERQRLYPQAVLELQKASDLSGAPEPKSMLAYSYAVSGRRTESRRLLEQLKALVSRQYVAPKHVALVYAGLGEKDEMFDWLEKAFVDRDISLTFLKVEPRWDEYRKEPRFSDLLRRVGFSE